MIAVTVIDTILKSIAEAVNKCNGLIVDLNAVEDVTGDDKQVRSGLSNAIQYQLQLLKRIEGAKMNVTNLRYREAVEVSGQIIDGYIVEVINGVIALNLICINRRNERVNRIEEAVSQH